MGKKAQTRKITSAQIETALRANFGNVSQCAKSLGCTRHTLWTRIQRSSHLQQVLQECRETIKDIAEGNIFRRVVRGDIGCSQWVLARLGRDRGYGDKVETPLSGVITVELDWGDTNAGTASED